MGSRQVSTSRTPSDQYFAYEVNRHNHGHECKCPTCIAGREWVWEEVKRLREIADAAWDARKLLYFWASRGVSPAELDGLADELGEKLGVV